MNTAEVQLLHFVLLRLAWGIRSAKRLLTPVYAILANPGDVICPYCGHGLEVCTDKKTYYACGFCGKHVEVGTHQHGLYCAKPILAKSGLELPVLPIAKDMGPSSATPPWRM